jgi:hypothetical protein
MQPLGVAVSDSFLTAPADGQQYLWFRGDSLIASGQQTLVADTSALYSLEMVDFQGIYRKSCPFWVEVVPPNGITDGVGNWAIGPNPASDWLSICSASEATLTIRNGLGQTALLQSLYPGYNKVDVSILSPGCYTIIVQSPSIQQTQKIVIVKQ